MEIGTIKLSAEQAENVIDNVANDKGLYSMEVPKTNGCIRFCEGTVTLRKLPVKFRGGDKRSKAFRLKGPVELLRQITPFIEGRWSMDITKK